MADIADMKAKIAITANVTGADLLDKFGVKLNTVGKTADVVNKQMAGLSNGVKALFAGFGASQLSGFVGELARVTIQLDAFGKQLSIGFGQQATVELTKLRTIMRELGISQDEALGSAVRFTSALRMAGQTSSDANRNFEAASKLILSNKLSADGAQRVYYAMAQIASKGKLYAEELQQQLGENLGGFTTQVAHALGMTSAQLQKAMKDGKVSADDFFNALQHIGDGIDPTKLQSAAQSLGKMKNAWFDFKASILSSDTVKSVLDETTQALTFLKDNSEGLSNTVKSGLAVAFELWAFSALKSAAASASLFMAENSLVAQAVRNAEARLAEAEATNIATMAMAEHIKVVVGDIAAERAAAEAIAVTSAEVVAATEALAAAKAEAFAAEAGFIAAGEGAGVLATAGAGLMALFTPLNVLIVALAGATYYFSQKLSDTEKMEQAVQNSGKGLSDTTAAISRLVDERTGKTRQLNAELELQYRNELKLGTAKTLNAFREAQSAAQSETTSRNSIAGSSTPGAPTYAGATSLPNERITDAGKGLNDLIAHGAAPSDIMNYAKTHNVKLSAPLFHGYSTAWNNQRLQQAIQKYASGNGLKGLNKTDIQFLTAAGIYTGNEVAHPDAPLTGGTKGHHAKGPTPVQIEKSYADQMDSIFQEDIKARRAVTNSIEDQYKDNMAAWQSEKTKRLADITASTALKGKENEARRIALLAMLAQLDVDKKALIDKQHHDAIIKQQTEVQTSMLQGQIDILQAEQPLARTAAERLRIQNEIIDLELKIKRAKVDELVKTSTGLGDLPLGAMADYQNSSKIAGIKKGQNEIDASPLKKYRDELQRTTGDMKTAFENVQVHGLQTLEDGLMGVIDGTKSLGQAFGDMAKSIIADLARIAIEKTIVSALGSLFGGLFGDGAAFSGGAKAFAKGGAFSGGIEYFAGGGVVHKPTAFGMSGGRMGVMGEAGPEAIMPLRRLANGRLGVENSGGSGMTNNVSVSVNVDGTGSSVHSDSSKADALGRAISNAVKVEIVNQRRPGGLLAA